MKEYLVLILALTLMLTGCAKTEFAPQESTEPQETVATHETETAEPQETTGTQEAASNMDSSSLHYGERIVHETMEQLFDGATFFVRGTINERIVDNQNVFSISIEEDYTENLFTRDDETIILVAGAPPTPVYPDRYEYEVGKEYFFVLTGWVSPKLKSVETAYYDPVEEGVFLEIDGDVVNVISWNGVDAASYGEWDTTTLDAAIREYVEKNSELLQQKAEEDIPDYSAGSLQQAVELSDALWKITIKEMINRNAGNICCFATYHIDSVIKGDPDYLNESFNTTIPTELAEEGGEYILLLSYVDSGSYTDLQAVFEDYWLLPIDSDEAAQVLDMFG